MRIALSVYTNYQLFLDPSPVDDFAAKLAQTGLVEQHKLLLKDYVETASLVLPIVGVKIDQADGVFYGAIMGPGRAGGTQTLAR